MLPNFFIIGAARAGTSSLYQYLGQHPQVFLPSNKEPMFFALEGRRASFKGPGDDLEINRKAIADFRKYCALFEKTDCAVAVGEASALYLYSDCAAQRIFERLPHAKIIALLRNPVDRAYSSFLYMIREGRERETEFARALALEQTRITANWEHIWHYKRMGYYYEQLKRYYDLFPSEHIKVFLTDELNADPSIVIRKAFTFLGVDADFKPRISLKYNRGGFPKNALLNTILTRPHRLKAMLKPFLPQPIIDYYVKLKQDNLVQPEMTKAIRQALLEDYRKDIVQTQMLIGRDLSEWLQ